MIREKIGELENVAAVGGERQDAIEHILACLTRLSSEVADASHYLPAYDQRTCQEAIKALREQFEKVRATFKPKTRFQFKNRNGVPHKPFPASECDGENSNTRAGEMRWMPVPSSDGNDIPPPKCEDPLMNLPGLKPAPPPKNYNAVIATSTGIRKPSFSTVKEINIAHHNGLHIVLPGTAAAATSSGTVTDLDQCVIDMSIPTISSGVPAPLPFRSLALKNIKNSLIICGHVEGPVHITNLKNCVVMAMAQQVRIHECEDVTFYLHVLSRPIIEDCKNVRFAKTPAGYVSYLSISLSRFGGEDTNTVMSQLTEKQQLEEANLFDQVDDFKWLKATPSPHWSLVPEEEIIQEPIWKKYLVGRIGPAKVEDTLRAFGILGKGT